MNQNALVRNNGLNAAAAIGAVLAAYGPGELPAGASRLGEAFLALLQGQEGCCRFPPANNWARVREAALLHASESEEAEARMLGLAPPIEGSGGAAGETVTIVGRKLGMGPSTVRLCMKLYKKALELNPGNPEASPVAAELIAGKGFAPVARAYGITSPARPADDGNPLRIAVTANP